MHCHIGLPIQQNLCDMNLHISPLNDPSIRWLSTSLSMQDRLIERQLNRPSVVVVVIVIVGVGGSIVIENDTLCDFSIAFHQKVSFIRIIQHFRHS
jgi:hypothetical protein